MTPHESEDHLRMLVEYHKGVSAVMVDPCAVLSLFAKRDALVAENERLSRGDPDPNSTRFRGESEPWEGNGPCMDCEGRSPYWHAPNDLWQRVMDREGEFDHHDPPGLICPVCFVIRAWKKDLPEFRAWWTWTPIPPDFLPRGDFDWAIARRNEVLAERDRLREDRDWHVEQERALRNVIWTWGLKFPTGSPERGAASEALYGEHPQNYQEEEK
jgi:hypothetical protein